MARSRILKPEFFQNEDLASLPFEHRLLFAGLWTLADRDGRLLDRPRRIGAALFPYDQVETDDGLTRLAALGLIDRYEVDGVAIIQIPQFVRHQNPHPREQSSELPAKTQSREKALPGRVKALPSREKVMTSRAVSTSTSTSVSTSASDPVPARVPARPPAPNARSRHPVYRGQRLVVFDWQLEDCLSVLGPHIDAFGSLDEWFELLDIDLVARDEVPPRRDGGAWLQERLWGAIQARGLPLRRAAAKAEGGATVLRPDVYAWECPHAEPRCTARGPCHTRSMLEAARARMGA